MPTNEPLVALARRKGGIEHPHRRPYPEPSSPATGTIDADSPRLLQNASGIQSMLRNTTELGNVGQFSAKQHRVPSPTSRTTPKLVLRPRVGSRNFSQPLPYDRQGHYSGDGRHVSKASRHGLSPTGHEANLSPHSPIYRQRTPFDEYQTYSMTQSSYITHSLIHRRPYIHGAHYHSRGPVQTFRSQSPFAYPTRLKRPGYRPSSPALGLNKSASNSDPDRGRVSRTSSPASTQTMSRVPTPWQQVANRSDSIIRYYPALQRAPSSRGSTPRPTLSLRSGASSTQRSQVPLVFPGAWPESPALSPPPLFYDYSEAFEGQTHIHPTNLLVVTPPSTPEDDQHEYLEHSHVPEPKTPTELPPGSPSAHIPELSSSGDGENSPGSGAKYRSERERSDTNPQGQSMVTPDLSVTAFRVLDSTSAEPRNAEQPKSNKTHQTNPDLAAKMEHEISEAMENRASQSSVSKGHQATGTQVRPEQHSSSPAASIYSVQSSAPLENSDDVTVPTSGADTATASPEGPPSTPIRGSPPSECTPSKAYGHTSDEPKAPASITSTRNDYPEIIAPTPERSITSLSNRDRFSKILGLDEALLERDRFSVFSARGANKYSHAASPTPKTHPRSQERSTMPGTTDHPIAEESNSDDEGELSNGLMETFGKLNESLVKDDVTYASAKTPVLDMRDSPSPLPTREPIGKKRPTSIDVRLSHRKTVINGRQRLTAENLAVCGASQAAEKWASDTALADSPLETKSADADENLSPIVESSLAIKAFSPPSNISNSDLPFAFTPLVRPPSEDDSLPELEATTSFYVRKHDTLSDDSQRSPWESGPLVDRTPSASPPNSRPWNLDASYPWDDEGPSTLDVVLPLPQRETRHSVEKHPKFKLRIHRASSSNASRLTKKRRSSEDTKSSVIASSIDILKSGSFSRRPKPSQSVAPGQSNSSHDITGASPMQTRFVESFERPSPASPAITLLPPSPGHDVRSFFSDDSSQARPRGTLRKRLSDLRARSSRANSVDHVSGYDRGLLNSAFGLSRASGRSSRQSQTTARFTSNVPRTRRSPWNVLARIRAWLSCREQRFQDRKQKGRHISPPIHASSPSLHARV